ncbi:free fatty acid receptor 2 isoform X1 [Tupaia chinensis]|nr:free fatty acid receptor 2 isoform X1 [Tupaia chinensis]
METESPPLRRGLLFIAKTPGSGATCSPWVFLNISLKSLGDKPQRTVPTHPSSLLPLLAHQLPLFKSPALHWWWWEDKAEKNLCSAKGEEKSSFRMLNWYSALVLTAYILIFLTGFPANLLALRAFLGRVRQPQPAPVHILLLSLTLADLLLLLLLPFKIIEAASNFHWYLPEIVCALTGFGFYSSIYCSTWLLAGISIERYLGVAFPVQYKLSRRPVYGVIAALVAWIMSFGHCTIVIIVQYLNTTQQAENANQNTCYENFTDEQLDVVLPVRLELCLVLFFIPMAVTIFCYWRFVWIMLTQPHVGAQRRRRAVGLAVVTLLNFLVCFGPYNVSHLVGFYNWKSPQWRSVAVVFSSLNASLDPVLFYFSSSAVRRTFGRGLQLLRNRGSSLLGRKGKDTAEVTNGDRGVSQADGVPSSDFTTD